MCFKNGTIHSRDFHQPKFFEAQHKIGEILNKYFEGSIRANLQRQSYFYATQRWRDIKIALMNELAKVKSHHQTQLSGELCKPKTNHNSYFEIRDSIELLVSMVEMTWGLQWTTRQQSGSLMHNQKRSTTSIVCQEAGPA